MAVHKILYFCEAHIDEAKLGSDSVDVYIYNVYNEWLSKDETGHAIRLKEMTVDDATVYEGANTNVLPFHMIFVNDSSFDSYKVMSATWREFAATKGITYSNEVVHEIPALFQNAELISEYGDNTRYQQCLAEMIEDTVVTRGYTRPA